MALWRWRLTALAVAVLAFVGAACEPPPPQMQLTYDIDPSGTYEILTKVVTINVAISCTRATRIGVTASTGSPNRQYLTPVDPYVSGLPLIVIRCPGPAATRFTTKWKWDATAPTGVVPVLMTGNTEEYPGSIPAVDRATTAVEKGVTFNHILCWPGAPSCSMA
jgi:hypothetical protein